MKSGIKSRLDKCLTPYRDLLDRVDRLLYRIQRRYSAQIACHKGCNCGCRNLSVFPIEALSLAGALQNLPAGSAARIRKRAAMASFWECPLLEDRACSLYAFRPVICRTHGFPLQTIYNERLSIGYCRHNFRRISPIPNDAVIDLDPVNAALRTINASAVIEIAHVLKLPDRLSIAEALLLAVF
jgi:Fe-S-cluster containining protein